MTYLVNTPTAARTGRRSSMRFALLAAATAFAASACFAQADPWPTRPIRIVTPAGPGTDVADWIPRTLGPYVTAQTKQPVVVDNKPGGNSVPAMDAIKSAPADGHTFLVGGVSMFSVNPAVYQTLPYDPVKDVVGIGMFTIFPFFVMVRKDSPYNTLPQLLDAAKASPGKVSCANAQVTAKVACSLFAQRSGTDILSVPFKSSPDVLAGIIGGVVDFAITDALSGTMALGGGLLKVLAVTSATRLPQFPAVPTVADTLPGFVFEGWLGLSARAGTPRPILEKMNAYLRQALAEPEFRNGIEEKGGTVRPMSVAEHNEWVAADRARWKEWIKQANIPTQ